MSTRIEYTNKRLIKTLSSRGISSKELCLISWGNNPIKVDIRKWVGDKAQKGICLDEDETRALYEGLKEIFQEKKAENNNAQS